MLESTVEQKSAKIIVRTTISMNGEEETFELTTFGNFYQKSHALYLQYEEHLEEGKVKSIVKIANEEILILRSGAVNMRMLFTEGVRHPGRYDTPYGTLGIETRTKKLRTKLESKIGSMDILYDLYMQGALAGTYHLEVSFEEEQK